jgi:hypothetical protein
MGTSTVRIPFVITDPVEGTFESPSWDIQSVHISLVHLQGLFIGVDTVGPFDRDGGMTSALGETDVYMEFREYWGGAVIQTEEMVLTATTETYYENAMKSGGRYAIGTDLEIEIGAAMQNDLGMILDGRGKCRFYLRLDDTGTGLHDEVFGIIPEPGTLALLALGAAAMIRRRVQRTVRPTSPARWSGPGAGAGGGRTGPGGT